MAGFIFIQSISFLRYKIQDNNGYFLIFSALIAGFFLYALTFIAVFDFGGLKPYELPGLELFYTALLSTNLETSQAAQDLTITTVTTLLVSISLLLVFKIFGLILPKSFVYSLRNKTIVQEFVKRTGPRGEFFHTCFGKAMPILIILKSRKAYVGFISKLPYEVEKEERNMEILPLRSGYRDENTLSLDLNNNYDEIWDEIVNVEDNEINIEDPEALEHFGVIINWNDIETSSIWIPEIYHRFAKEQNS